MWVPSCPKPVVSKTHEQNHTPLTSTPRTTSTAVHKAIRYHLPISNLFSQLAVSVVQLGACAHIRADIHCSFGSQGQLHSFPFYPCVPKKHLLTVKLRSCPLSHRRFVRIHYALNEIEYYWQLVQYVLEDNPVLRRVKCFMRR